MHERTLPVRFPPNRSLQHGFGCLLAILLAGCSGPTAAPFDPRSDTTPTSSTTSASLSADDAAEALVAAQNGLRSFLLRIPETQRAAYGFASREEIDRATLGAPYRVWTADAVRVEQDAAAEGDRVQATREWRFPVTVDGEYRALLTVGAVGAGPLKAVDFGAAGLAKELGRREKDRTVSPKARRVLLRLYELRADFVAFPSAAARVEEFDFEALASARGLPQAPAGAVRLRHLLPWLKERFGAARWR
ncbi:MAG: hypothetical protein QM765_28160 [Myxococcales bacterium]